MSLFAQLRTAIPLSAIALTVMLSVAPGEASAGGFGFLGNGGSKASSLMCRGILAKFNRKCRTASKGGAGKFSLGKILADLGKRRR